MRERLLTVMLSVATTVVVMTLLGADATPRELVVDRLIVRRELIVSDTGKPWEEGFENHKIPRGMVARSPVGGRGEEGVWVRGRLIKCDIDDPFDDRFHAINRDGSMFRMPGHISWSVWLQDAWRQLAIVEGETLEDSEVPPGTYDGSNHPGRLRFQSFRPNHGEPMTDATIGQGKMSLGGGGFGGGGLPYASEVLQVWGGKMQQFPVQTPSAPRVLKDDGSGKHTYALIAVGPQGHRSEPSPAVTASGLASLSWDSAVGADAYIVVRDGKEVCEPIRIEGSEKHWMDKSRP